MGRGPEPAVLVQDLWFAYPGGGFELAVAACRVEPGEAVGLVGPSGSGKTTLLDLVAGIRLAGRGVVAAGGFEWARHSDAARRRRRIAEVGLVFQELELLDHLSVRENVLLPYLVNPALRLDGAVRARATELCESCGIGALTGRRPRELSQGERQRVALCRALATRPSLVLADEPTGNLDADTAASVVALLLEQVRGRGATLLMVTHDHGLLRAFDRVLDLARLAAPGAPAAGGARA